MRTSTLFTFVSLFLIGSYSLPQPENLEASRTIEEREAKTGPGGPFPSHKGDGDWKNHHHGSDAGSSTSNSTKVKEREVPHERPSSIPEFLDHKHHDGSESGSWSESSGTNSTKIKERQEHGPPPGGEWTPPKGMTWKEYMKHMKNKGGSPTQSASGTLSTGTSSGTTSSGTETDYTGPETNSTKVKMIKFRD